jgi:hypothetical protein
MKPTPQSIQERSGFLQSFATYPGHESFIIMGAAISWLNDNLADDERQGEARDENQPQSVWGESTQYTRMRSQVLTAKQLWSTL